METNLPDTPVCRKRNIRDNTLDDAQLKTRCPLDNGRHNCNPISASFPTNQLDSLPLELIIEVLLQVDIPSLTRFRGLNRRTMQLVNSVRQYTAMIEHCPNIIRAIVSIQVDAFDCSTLYRTLCTSRCSTCNHFGDYLYLIDCRRVCYFCFTELPEYFPLTSHAASRLFTLNAKSNAKSFRKLFELVKPPSILSLPGRYCCGSLTRGGNLQSRRLRLYDRRAVAESLTGSGLSQSDKTNTEPKRFMAIISAPVLLNGGRQVDRGFFCLGCRNEHRDKNKHFRIKYTTEGLSGHIAKYGRVVERIPKIPGTGFMHVKKD
ncbi:uncharacterized protein LACBIDRAFT_292411 [Laccaria bicolor S238N-H82]|uniref:Predicted protein n=1 Tax=Laccaria bicolor (strain S238N-H82 / ATCC MYA-4686) TaxID=486041 RepID=B0CWZ2_LACBS|nr:uncharacterized protein LACBIDRAFT_292411 [Laccaria bicolor S238N-H82]EDR13153.1 predicted protein [Laccaria bicolor S238N-H82]|eukprot:XP_001875651.1 predicted protein [Laccaria bicolor S238N-H82]